MIRGHLNLYPISTTLTDMTPRRPNGRGEALVSGYPRAEPFVAKPAPESPAETEHLMEEVCDRENLQSAWKRV